MFTTKNLFKIFGTHFLIALGVIIVAVIFVSVLSGKITAVSASTAKDRQTATALSEQTSLLSNLKRESEIIGTNQEVFEDSFIPSNNILAFVSALDSLAQKNGLTHNPHFSTPVASTLGTPLPLNTVSYQNTFITTLPLFISYLKDFENLHYFTKIQAINITSANANWQTDASISFTADVSTKIIQ